MYSLSRFKTFINLQVLRLWGLINLASYTNALCDHHIKEFKQSKTVTDTSLFCLASQETRNCSWQHKRL